MAGTFNVEEAIVKLGDLKEGGEIFDKNGNLVKIIQIVNLTARELFQIDDYYASYDGSN